jgi:hypothetical protein
VVLACLDGPALFRFAILSPVRVPLGLLLGFLQLLCPLHVMYSELACLATGAHLQPLGVTMASIKFTMPCAEFNVFAKLQRCVWCMALVSLVHRTRASKLSFLRVALCIQVWTARAWTPVGRPGFVTTAMHDWSRVSFCIPHCPMCQIIDYIESTRDYIDR